MKISIDPTESKPSAFRVGVGLTMASDDLTADEAFTLATTALVAWGYPLGCIVESAEAWAEEARKTLRPQ